MTDVHSPPLQVVGLIATLPSDPDRGTAVFMRSEDAAYRLMQDGELVWVHGPRRHELATLHIDDELPRGSVVLRDVAGASPSEIVRVTKIDTDTPPSRMNFA